MVKKDPKQLKVDIAEMPADKDLSEYPPNTIFVHKEVKIERDPITGLLKKTDKK